MPPSRNVADPSLRARLAEVRLFRELEDEDLDRLASFARLVKVRRKESLFVEGEPYAGMYVLLSGLAVVFKLAEDGRMLILHVCRPGDSIAEAPLLEERNAVYPAHGRATRDGELAFFPRERIQPFLKRHPEFAWEMLRTFASRLKELGQQLEGVTLREVTSRLARYLLREAEAAGVLDERQPSLVLPIAKGSLASYLGTVHETLSRTFARLIRQGIVRVDGPRVTILDMGKLRRLA